MSSNFSVPGFLACKPTNFVIVKRTTRSNNLKRRTSRKFVLEKKFHKPATCSFMRPRNSKPRLVAVTILALVSSLISTKKFQMPLLVLFRNATKNLLNIVVSLQRQINCFYYNAMGKKVLTSKTRSQGQDLPNHPWIKPNLVGCRLTCARQSRG